MSKSSVDKNLMYCAECGNKTLEFPYESAPDDCIECRKRLSGGARFFPHVNCATAFKEKKCG